MFRLDYWYLLAVYITRKQRIDDTINAYKKENLSILITSVNVLCAVLAINEAAFIVNHKDRCTWIKVATPM